MLTGVSHHLVFPKLCNIKPGHLQSILRSLRRSKHPVLRKRRDLHALASKDILVFRNTGVWVLGLSIVSMHKLFQFRVIPHLVHPLQHRRARVVERQVIRAKALPLR